MSRSLSALLCRWFVRGMRTRPPDPGRRRFLPRLEVFEERTLPSTAPGPVPLDDFVSANAGTAVTINPLANDLGPGGALVPASVALTLTPAHGTATTDPSTGQITYLPAVGFFGTDHIAYTVKDVNGAISDPAIVTVIVNQPTANDAFGQTSANVPVTLDVLSNDTDPDGAGRLNPGSISLPTLPAHGTVAVNPGTGAITYTPGPGFHGTDSFVYTVRDLSGALSNPAVVTVAVTQNDSPNDDVADTDSGSPVTIDVLANDSSLGGALVPSTVLVTLVPAHGTAAVNPNNGAITYIPTPGFRGTDHFAYTVGDTGHHSLGPVGVSVVVNRPTAADDFGGRTTGSPLAINVLTNDADPDGPGRLAAASVTVVSLPAHGTVAVNPSTGVVTYVPGPGFHGTDSFAYTVADLTGAISNPAIVTVITDPAAGGAGTIGGTLFLDRNADGVQAADEPGLAGRTVYLDLNNDGFPEANEPTAVSDASGRFTFQGLAAGTYVVRANADAGVVPTGTAAGGLTVTLTDQNAAITGLGLGVVPLNPLSPVQVTPTIFPTGLSDPDVVFVQGVYHNLLGRDADPFGLGIWLGVLHQSADGHAAVVRGVWESAEHRGLEVDSYYRAFLGRPADALGRGFWMNAFLGGADEYQVTEGFLDSSEYLSLHAGSDAFVRALYQSVLGRSADDAGLSFWTNALNNGADAARVADGFVRSRESQQNLVDGYFAAFLHRAPDATGEMYWLSNLQGGGASPESVGVGFAISGEYLAAAARQVQR